ncbi:hypothetical protein HG535_0A06280 [Zygotorulaspora mrakii]|uniref:DNA polymerase n=1 Tax=Zygotorulaspora mrakii TaxID=42260 RepID=A0A7H9AWM0_ZYGMR|nr:uncharacterized protein HG535_0A06280 [Zygotorulaspora mrakii]QLG70686.1 hypothetical protein HG535_0A06280 [Zygotorulaspora mrakii]
MSDDETMDQALHSTLNPEHIHLQLNAYDYYMTKPGTLDTRHGNSLPLNEYLKVPVIRLYGSLSSGHQVLCHVHGVFPYFFLGYDGKETDKGSTVNQKCAQLHLQLESWCWQKADQKRKKRDVKNNGKRHSNGLTYISNVSVIKGVPFYGYHVGWSLFYKVSLLEVGFANKLADGIRDGSIFGRQVNCYESQLPYLLQFTTDFNLFCCSLVELEKCFFRTPLLNTALEMDKLLYTDELEKFITKFCDLKNNVLSDKDYPRIGNGLIEIDVLPQFIRNIDDSQSKQLHHEFIELLEDTSKLLCKPYVNSTKTIMRDLELQRRLLSLSTYTAAPSIDRVTSANVWQSTKQYASDFQDAMRRSGTRNSKLPDIESFISNDESFENIKSPTQSLNELWPITPNINVLEPLSNEPHDLIDTVEHRYSVTDLSDDEDNKDENSDLSDDNFEINSENQGKTSKEMEGHVSKRVPTDMSMTQSMAKRIKSQSISTMNAADQKDYTKHSRRGIKYGKNSFIYKSTSLNYETITKDLEMQGYPKIEYLGPYFGNPVDLRERPYVYAGKRFEITSNHLFSRISVPFEDENLVMDARAKETVFSSWKYLTKAPSYMEVKKNSNHQASKICPLSHVKSAASKLDSYFKTNTEEKEKKKKSSAVSAKNALTHLSLEIHAQTKGSKLPDPQRDRVEMICWCLEKETFSFDLGISYEGIMVVKNSDINQQFERKIQQAAGRTPIAFYEDEFDMFDALIDLVLILDPDILSGFELHNASWGYILERSRKVHHFEVAEELSRVNHNVKKVVNDFWGYSHASGIMVPGRHMINVWRALRSELNLTQYTIENISYKVLQERLPHFSFQDLSSMWRGHESVSKIRTVINYWLTRCRLNIALLQKQEYIPRVTEQARLTGIDFYSVYYRGSQYKIESILSRICKSENFLMLAPSRKQVQKQKALECVPLVMEPESAFYKSPLVVLDFQSLYPSIMIAYNYCYSTMIGRIRELRTNDNEIGVTKISLRRNLLTLLEKHIKIAPNGVAFVDQSVRKSTLAKMLEDILDTRFMVKKTMSDMGDRNASLKRILNSRQLALKLIANVTYGYASASFSGRMPCSDLADTIVQTGREILEKAIDLIEANLNWGARVVYGDTDSLFVYLPGKTREEAFIIGQEMAKEVTKCNPAPICLNFEKVYHPCLLLSKKRYVGFKYETADKMRPTFDAKGIETVRRDGHPAQQKVTENCLRILFETKDLSQVKQYVQNEFRKMHQGRILVQDFCFAKEVKLGSYKSEATAPPGAVVATRQTEHDHRAKPQYKERVPYVVVRGPQGARLRDRCLSLDEFFADESLELDSEYYITKTLVPPLERLFNVLGISIAEWAFEVPRHINTIRRLEISKVAGAVAFVTCTNCREENVGVDELLCEKCLHNSKETAARLTLKNIAKEADYKNISTVCRTCCYRYSHDANEVTMEISSLCNSYDCPVFYNRQKLKTYLNCKTFLNIKNALDKINKW